jgi:hypothetical protein
MMTSAGPSVQGISSLVDRLGQVRSLRDLAVETARMWDCDPEGPVSPEMAEGLNHGLSGWLRAELPRDLADHVFARLQRLNAGVNSDQALSAYLCERALPYLHMLTPWVSLWMAFAYASLAVCRHRKINEMFVLGRDALLFYPAAVRLARKLKWRIKVTPLNLNRRLLGLDDSPAGDGEASRSRPPASSSLDLVDYLNAALSPPKAVALVDSGYYGTIPWYLLERLRMKVDIMALYFSSRNPNLFGFMNMLVAFGNIKGVIVPYDFIVRAGDTVEAALKPYRIERFSRGGNGVVVEGQAAPLLAGFLALGSYWLMDRWGADLNLADLDPWQQLLVVYRLSRVKGADGWPVPLILPKTTPKWEMGPRWLKDWNLGPIPPMDDICGPRPG